MGYIKSGSVVENASNHMFQRVHILSQSKLLAPDTIPGMVSGTRAFKWGVDGPSGLRIST